MFFSLPAQVVCYPVVACIYYVDPITQVTGSNDPEKLRYCFAMSDRSQRPKATSVLFPYPSTDEDHAANLH